MALQGTLQVILLFSVLRWSSCIPLANFYPFGTSAGDSVLPRNDDGFSSMIPLSSWVFPYFSTTQSSLYVNNNGVVSFGSPVSSYTPQAFPISGMLLSPYWGDVDTRPSNGGFVYYRQTTDTTLLMNARDQIRAAFSPNFQTFSPTSLFIATWDHVGYYNQNTDKTNTFQCVMISDGTFSFVSFLYADGLIQWTTGDASGGSAGLGGIPAQGGFNAGDGVRFFSIPGSQTASIVNIDTTTNVGVPGLWTFRVDLNAITTPSAPVVNECALGLDTCSPNALCVDTQASYSCTCMSGYSGNGISCTNINECALGSVDCGPNGMCVDNIGSYLCVCDTGYELDANGRCQNINECVRGTHTCDTNAACIDTLGSFTCSCNVGFTGTGQSCTNINECASGLDNCAVNASCTDTVGSFNCACLRGYIGDGVSCSNVDECVQGSHNCDVNADCVDVAGSFYCVCRLGFSGSGTTCTNINECASGLSNCSVNGNCMDTIGSYQCSCLTGFSGDGVTCTDINECITATDNCDANADCFNTAGGFQCTCRFGYSGNGVSCTALPVPAPPLNFQSSVINATTVTITWQAPMFDPQNRIAFYNVTVSETQFGEADITVSTTAIMYTFTSLEEFNNYTCTVISIGVFGTYSTATTITFTTPQGVPTAAPRSPSGFARSPTLITIQWTPPPAIHINGVIRFYLVEVLEVITGQLFTFHAVDTFINVGPLHPGYAYQCRLAAFTTARGPYTNYFLVNSQDAPPTAPPQNFQVVILTSSSITLSWNPPPVDQQNGEIVFYVLNLTQRGNTTSFFVNGNSTSYTISNLLPFYDYQCTIAAHTTDTGPFSITVTVTLPESPPSAPPQNVNGYALDHTSIRLEWDPPPLSQQNGVITEYRINVTERETNMTFQFITNETSLEIYPLHPDYVYECQVAAVTSDPGPYTEVFPIRALTAAPSSPPLNFVVMATDSRSVFVQWQPPPSEDRNGPIIGYIINVTVIETGEEFQLFPTTNSITVTDLRPFTTYVCVIAARTNVGIGPFSITQTVITLEDVPSEPVDFTVSTIIGSSTELFVSWAPPLEPNGILTYYTVYCKEPETQPSVGSGSGEYLFSGVAPIESQVLYSDSLLATENQTVISGLTPFTVYECYVSANTSAGESNYSILLTARTDEDVPGDSPGDFVADIVSATSVSLRWSAPMTPNGVLTYYNLTYNLSGVATTLLLNASESNSLIITQLNEYTYYQFLISALTSVGAGPSDVITVRTDQARPSAPPQSVTAYVSGSRNATISWIPPDSDDQNGVTLYYILDLIDEGFNSTLVINTTLTTYTFNDLEEYNMYSCIIAAATVAGLGPYSDPTQFITMQDVPSSPPQSISAVVHSSTLITFMWSPPPPRDINGVILFYIIRLTERYTGRDWTFFAVDDDIRIGSLHPFYFYDFVVAAHTIGTGPNSMVFSVQTLPDIPIAPPNDVRAAIVTSNSITFTWEPPPFEETNGVIQYYQIEVREVETGQQLTRSSNATTSVFSDLHPFYNYEFIVAAFTIGLGPYSRVITTQLLEEAPTATPMSASGSSVDSESIFLQWSPPPFEHQNGLVRHYIINATELDTGVRFSYTTINTQFTVVALHPFYMYMFTIAAVTVAPGPATTPFIIQTDQDTPSAPVMNSTVTEVSSNSVIIQWEPPEVADRNGNIIGYVVNVTVMATGQMFQESTTSTSLVLGSLSPFTTYEIRIAARTEVGVGPFSISVIATTQPTAPSSPPESLSVTVISSTSISLSWSPPLADNQNGIITEYRINITEANTGRVLQFTSAATSLFVPFLHPFYTYECIVSAFTVDEGPFTNVFAVTTLEDVPSGFPQNFQAMATNSQSARFTWDPPLLEDHNGIIVTYIINVSTANSRRQIVSNMTSLEVTNLMAFTTYFCVIAASTSVGIGPFSTVIRVQTPEDAPTSSPLNPTGAAADSRTIILSWEGPAVDVLNGILREYRVNVTETNTGLSFQRVTTTTSIEISSLHPFYTYQWSVAAFTVQEGPFTSSLSVTTPEDVPSGSPQDPSGEALNPTSISLNWDPPLLEDQNGLIVGYVVNISALETGDQFQFFPSSTNITVDSLSPFTTYECIVAARTSVGTGPASTVVLVQTLEDAPSSHPSNSSGYALNSTHIFLDWDPPLEDEVNGVIREYRINITEGETGSLFLYTTNPDTTELVVGQLHPYYTYHCTIVAYTVEVGPYTAIITVRTEEDAPSGPPTSFNGVVTDSRSITFSWAPPLMEQQNGILRQYIITLSSVAGNETRVISSSLRSFTITGLTPFVTYSCIIQAQTVRIGPPTPAIDRTTSEDAPTGPPLGVTADPLDPTTLLIEWLPSLPIHTNGIIRGFSINVTEIDTGIHQQLRTTSLNITIPSLHPFYRYSYSVSTETIGPGPFSDPRIVQMPESAPGTPPIGITASSITSTSFVLTWQSPELDDQNGVIRSYNINVTEVNTGRQFQVTSQSERVLLESLHPYYNYSCVLAAVTIQSGPYSAAIQITTQQDIPSGPPLNPAVIVSSSTSLTLSWVPPSDPNRNGVITGYVVALLRESDQNSTQFTTSNTSILLQGLKPFTTYTCTVSALTVIGRGPFSTSLTATTFEDAPDGYPTMLAAVNVTSTSVTLSWEAPSIELHNGIIRHYLIRAHEAETGSNTTYQATAHTQFTAGELHPYYTYTFHVQAITVSNGPLSLPLTVRTLQDAPSDSPRNIIVTPINPRTLSITWSPPLEESLNGVILRYHINVSVAETGVNFQRTVTGVTSLLLDSVHPYYTYSIIIAAATSLGIGPFSVVNSIRTPEDAPTSPPLNVMGEAVNSTFVLLTWEPPLLEERNGIIISYYIQLLEVATNLTLTYQRPTHTNQLIGSLHPAYDYQFSVAAETSAGRGPATALMLVQTLEDAPGGAPRNVTAEHLDSMTVQLTWQPPAPELQNGVIVEYRINVSVVETKTSYLLSSVATQYVVSDLHPFYGYMFSIAAVTNITNGVGPYSVSYATTTLEDVPTGVPENVVVLAVSSTSIRLSWEAPLANVQNGIIRSYHISVYEVETGLTMTFVTQGTDSLLIVNSLHPFYTYNCSITAFTVGFGPTLYVTVQTFSEEPSDVPQNIAVRALTADSAQVSWDPPPPEHRNGIITGYTVRVVGLQTDEDYLLSLSNGSDVTVQELHPFYTFKFSVAARSIGLGPFSNSITFQMPEAAPLGLVSDVNVSVYSPTAVTVSWLPPHPDNWNGVITRYVAEYSILRPVGEPMDTGGSGGSLPMFVFLTLPLRNNPDPSQAAVPLTRESVRIEGLEEHHVYMFSVYYENSVGRSSGSVPVEQSTDGAAPSGPPILVTISAESSTSLLIMWEPPELLERNGDITGYVIELFNVRNGTSKMYNVSNSLQSLQIEGLPKFTEFTVSIAARNVFDVGPFSQPIVIKTLEDLPGNPTGVIGEAVSGTSITITWKEPLDSNGVILGYEINYFGYKLKTQARLRRAERDDIEIVDGPYSIVVNSDNTQVQIDDLMEGLTYEFKVRANTTAGYGPYSPPLAVNLTTEGPTKVDEPSGRSDSGTAAIIAVAVIGWILLVIVIILVVAIVIYWKKLRGKGLYVIRRKKKQRSENPYELTAARDVINPVAVEYEDSEAYSLKNDNGELGKSTEKPQLDFREESGDGGIEKTEL